MKLFIVCAFLSRTVVFRYSPRKDSVALCKGTRVSRHCVLVPASNRVIPVVLLLSVESHGRASILRWTVGLVVLLDLNSEMNLCKISQTAGTSSTKSIHFGVRVVGSRVTDILPAVVEKQMVSWSHFQNMRAGMCTYHG